MYEFTKLHLTQKEFNNLLFMNPPDHEEDKLEDKFLESLCAKPLKYVVQKVMEKSSHNGKDPTQIFQRIDAKSKPGKGQWFKRHTLLSEHFTKELMDRLWIRNLTLWKNKSGEWKGERSDHQKCSFYITDGNHRALVYAVHVACGETYEPVKAIHATSWDIASGILGWQPQPAHALERNGKLKGKNQSYKDQFCMHIELFERSSPSSQH